MLTLTDHDPLLGRRSFLTAGTLGLGGLSLNGLLSSSAQAKDDYSRSGVLRDRSVIFLFLHGGPSQTETFDPKMTAPVGVQSATGELQTSIPGVTFGGTFPHLARLADQLSIVRSFQTGDGNHDIKPIVGRNSLDANLGSVYSRVAGTSRTDSGMPTNVALFPQAVVPEAQPAVRNFGDFTSAGTLGNAYRPFVPGADGEAQQNMTLQIDRSRLEDRRHLLSRLDGLRRTFDQSRATSGINSIRDQAFETITGGVAQAFDLSQESPDVVRRYDTAGLLSADDISRKWNYHKNYVDNV
ncbi:MAG: DUF1501 domain-containing protein, partial [Planctomycetaceae bacterium]